MKLRLKRILTRNPIFLVWIQDPLMIDTLGQIFLGLFAKLKVLHGHLTDKFEVFFKFITRCQVVIVELHAGDVRICRRTYPERRHTATVDIQSTIGEKVQEQTVIRLLGVCDVLGKVVPVVDSVKCGRVVDRKRWVGVLAVQTFLVSVHPRS